MNNRGSSEKTKTYKYLIGRTEITTELLPHQLTDIIVLVRQHGKGIDEVIDIIRKLGYSVKIGNKYDGVYEI